MEQLARGNGIVLGKAFNIPLIERLWPEQADTAMEFARFEHARTLDPSLSRVVVTLRCVISMSQGLPTHEQVVGASRAIIVRQYAGIGHYVSKSVSQRIIAHFGDCLGRQSNASPQ